METTIYIDSTSLKWEIENYLYDVGFTNDLYELKYWHDRYYVEIFFRCESAIDYLMKDIIKYRKKYEVKKYINKDIISAIITYI